ncbi:MAG TPA: hypothetical protein PLV25_04780, partial [Opitutales bacterium]|nr:hypothetical protein [Opitutales bacterium]
MKHISLSKKAAFEFGRKELNLIAAFRGLPEDRSHSRIKPVKGLDSLIDKLIKKNGWEATESP